MKANEARKRAMAQHQSLKVTLENVYGKISADSDAGYTTTNINIANPNNLPGVLASLKANGYDVKQKECELTISW
jgi:hypothetical protein